MSVLSDHAMKSIFIVDDHDIVRFGLEAVLKNIPEFKILGYAGNLSSAVNAIKHLQPDLLITDMSLPDSQGLDTVRAMVHAQGSKPVLVVSMHDELIYAEQVLALLALLTQAFFVSCVMLIELLQRLL